MTTTTAPTPSDAIVPGEPTLEELAAENDTKVDDASIEAELLEAVMVVELSHGRRFEWCLEDTTAAHVRRFRAMTGETPEEAWRRIAQADPLSMEDVERVVLAARITAGEEGLSELGITRRALKGARMETRKAAPFE